MPLFDRTLPQKLRRFRELQMLEQYEPEGVETEIRNLAHKLIDIMETELRIEGILR